MQKPWLSAYDPDVPASIDYPTVPVYEPFLAAAAAQPGADALVYRGAVMAYGTLRDQAVCLAGELRRLGVHRGERVAILLPNCPQMVIGYYAVLMTGAAAVMLSPRLVEREFAQMVADTSPTALITLDEYMPMVLTAGDTGIGLVVSTGADEYASGGAPAPPTAAPDGVTSCTLASLLAGDSPEAPPPDIDPREDTALFIYTGGTTGMPKAVMLSHYAVVANALQLGSWVPLGKGDVALAALPMFHSFGMSTGINTPLYKGATVVLVAPDDPAALAAAIERYRPSLFVAVPDMVAGLLEHPGAAGGDLSSLRYCFAGAAMLPRKVKERFEQASGAAVLEGYGLTEAVTAQSANPAHGENRAGSIGLPFPDVEFRIVDMETGTKELPPEKVGELTVRSPCLMQGYHNKPAETAKALRDGWLFTSDIGWMDPDGYFYVIDRKKDLVISGAFKTYPAEVEQVLETMPGVREAAVVGLFDDFRGHSLKAFVVPVEGVELSEADVLEFCRANLSAHKVPRVVVFRKQLPRSALGKILREELE